MTDDERTNGEACLPALIDQAGIRRELGVGEAAADKILRSVTLVRFPELRKVLAYRNEVLALMQLGETKASI